MHGSKYTYVHSKAVPVGAPISVPGWPVGGLEDRLAATVHVIFMQTQS
jgi:hypothetical protein